MRPTPLSRIKALLFDLDGLLVDTEPLQKAAFQEICRRRGAADFEMTDELHGRLVGKSDLRNAETLIALLGLEMEAEQFVSKRADIYAALLAGGVPLMPDALETIRWARGRGMRLAVGSSSVRRFVKASLNGALPDWRGVFEAVVCGDDPGVQSRKPAPDIYLRCAALLKTAPGRCCVLEDSGSGVESARRAGVGFIAAVPNAHTRGHDFSKAHKVMRSLAELRMMSREEAAPG